LPRETAATLGALIRAVESGELHAQIKLVVSDNPEAYCLERARQARLSCFTFYPRKYPDKATYEGLILRQLRELNVEYIVLAGYMRLIGPYPARCLPRADHQYPPFPAPRLSRERCHWTSLGSGGARTGVTIHYVDEGMDTGPIIAQWPVTIDPGETRESLAEKIHAVEHEFYPKVLQEIFTKRRESLD